MSEATILHADLDAFYASVEQRDDPRLRGRPVIVGAGVVLAASYEARGCGVRTAMGGRQARRLCPSAVVVRPRMSAYAEASKAVYRVFEDMAPLVEGLSIDEAFLDVRGLEHISGTPLEIAARLRRVVLEQVGLPITVGVARTKFLAKVASGVAKPDGLLVVPPDGELGFLQPLPVERLWGVGRVTARRSSNDRGIQHGGPGRGAQRGSARRDARPRHRTAPSRARAQPRPTAGRSRAGVGGSIGSQRALGRSTARARRGRHRARRARRPRHRDGCEAAGRVGRTVVLRLRFDDYSRATRSHTLARATADTHTILAAMRALLQDALPLIERRGPDARRVVGREPGRRRRPSSSSLPLDPYADGALDASLDEIRRRFGAKAVTRAVLLGRELGPSVPLLPD